MCVAGTLRLAKDYKIVQIPYARKITRERLYDEEKLFPQGTRDLLTLTIEDHGGRDISFEDGYLKCEIPVENFDSFMEDMRYNAKRDKNVDKIFNLKDIDWDVAKYDDEEPETSYELPSFEEYVDRTRTAPEKERGGRDERKLTRKEGPVKKKKEPRGGFRVEIPLNVLGLMRRLMSNRNIQALLEEYDGQPLKGKDLTIEFPDRSKRSEILDELANVINTSGFLREVLDTSEI